MPSSPGPYQSRLFNFLNRQSLRFRDRLGETFRHLQSAAQLGAQALLYPLYWLFHPHRWTGPLLTPGYSEPQLPPQTGPSLSDEPLRRVLERVRPWFNDDDPPAPTRENPPALKALTPLPLRPVVVPGTVLARLEQKFSPPALSPGLWPFRRRSLPPDLVICGVASRLSDRQLVLTTDDNQTLDVLSPEQSQTLAQSIRVGLANFYYQRRLAWALERQTWGAISLVNPETDALTPPLHWLWRGLHWWESGALILPPAFPKTEAPVLAPLTELGLAFRRRWPSLTPSPLAVVHLPQSLPPLPALGEILPASGPLLERLNLALAPLKTALGEKLSPQSEFPDPFQIQVLIQAAIAYFFGSGADASRASGPLPLGEPDSPWLSWQDLASPSSLPLTPGDSALVSGVSPNRPRLTPALPRGRKPASTGAALNASTPEPPTDFWLETGTLPSASTLVSREKPDLDTAFDWIEIVAQPIGYHKHPLEWILEGLDRLVLALEEALRWLWRRVSPLFFSHSKKLS